MAKKYYFFQTLKVCGRSRLRPLEGQQDLTGKPIDKDMNVQADSRMREDYPLGTVFGSDKIERRCLGSTHFYASGDIHPLGLKSEDYKSPEHQPSKEMQEAYEAFKSKGSAAVV